MKKTGACACGKVTFQSEGPWRDIIACHCNECRRMSGHFWAATAVPEAALEITSDAGLKWFRSSDVARRGFCTGCGASLFYKHDDKGYVAIGAGCLDGDSGLFMIEEVFTHEKGDYYALTNGILHSDSWSEEWKND
ncbi:MAG: GFA family protein [Alphaproteobacteria bacterium]|nr:GFA family protein [Alphaproteobacteria bacterium]